MARTKSKPITLPPTLGIDSIDLKTEIPDAFEREDNSGVYVIPIDDEDYQTDADAPQIVIEPPSSPIEVEAVDVEESTELELADLEEIPLPEPRALGLAAAETLASTPLFSGMSQEALEALVAELQLVQLVNGEALFYEGDPGDALYVIVEGEVSVQAEGPPRVEMARLGAGAFLGEVALMTDQPRSATVTAPSTATSSPPCCGSCASGSSIAGRARARCSGRSTRRNARRSHRDSSSSRSRRAARCSLRALGPTGSTSCWPATSRWSAPAHRSRRSGPAI
jgi:hypothetical protein